MHSGRDGGCRVGEVRAGTTSPMPDHKGFKLQSLVNFQKFSTLRVKLVDKLQKSNLHSYQTFLSCMFIHLLQSFFTFIAGVDLLFQGDLKAGCIHRRQAANKFSRCIMVVLLPKSSPDYLVMTLCEDHKRAHLSLLMVILKGKADAREWIHERKTFFLPFWLNLVVTSSC